MRDREIVMQTESLSKRYGRLLALDGLSLDVRAGEVLGFLGPNGAGKTTTLRLLMGYLRPTAGSARLHGLDCWRDSVAVHARTGYLPGDVRLWPRMSARAIAAHLARLRGLDSDLGTVDLAKRLDVDLDRPVGELSKGNRQKAGVLLALLGDPELLLLDEPTSGLDPLVQQEFHAILRERVAAGAAAIAGEEDRGGLEVTLSAPVSRIRVFTGRCAGLVIGITILMIATGAALWIFSALLGMGLGVGAIASGVAALGLFGLFTGAVAIAVGAATGSATAARGLAALAAVASYLINALAQITSVMRPARPVSPYYLVLGNEPLAHGLRLIGAVSVLAAVAVLLIAGGIRFARRDLG